MATAAGGNNSAIKTSRMTAIIVNKIDLDVPWQNLGFVQIYCDVKFGAQLYR